MVNHTLETMDNCRIGWGRVVDIPKSGGIIRHSVEVETQSLILENGKLKMGNPIKKLVFLPLNRDKNKEYKIDDYISFHWHTVCGLLSLHQVQNLKKYTQIAIDLANKTL
jgi:hypothetical protein